MIRALLTWLGFRREPVRVGLRPRRDIEMPHGFDVAYSRVLEAIETVLGANVYVDDRTTGTIEAGFGLVQNERVRVSIEARGETHAFVRIEALFQAGAEIPVRSRAVDALADALAAMP